MLLTLADARAILVSLPTTKQRDERWLYAGDLLKEAANGRGAMGEAFAHLTRALRAEGLI